MSKVKKTVGGREKKYTAVGLEKACEAYFDSISFEEAVVRTVIAVDDHGIIMKDDKGHTMYRQEAVVAKNGKAAFQTVWIEPPSIMGLCLYLGLHRSTFLRYGEQVGDDEESVRFRNTVTRARGRVEAYNISKLEDKSAARGAIFNLQNNFGYAEKKEVEMGDKTRKAMTYGAGMTMKEKIEWLKEHGMDVSEFE